MYNGISPHQMNMSRNNQNNFNNAFQPNTTLIPNQTYNNPNNLSHNNVADNFFNEYLIDYTLHIDSADRDISSFPLPYNFILSLGGAGTSREKTFDPKTQNIKITNYIGVPNPRIEKNFTNVKYVILEKVFLPKYIIYIREYPVPGDITLYNYVGDESSGAVQLSKKYRYLAVRVKELDNNRIFSTNNNIRDDSFIIYRDKELGGLSGDVWISSPCRRQYLKSSLKNLSKLTLEIVDRTGNLIVPQYLDTTVTPNTIIDVPVSDLDRPEFQCTFQFTLQCYENEINTNVNYR